MCARRRRNLKQTAKERLAILVAVKRKLTAPPATGLKGGSEVDGATNALGNRLGRLYQTDTEIEEFLQLAMTAGISVVHKLFQFKKPNLKTIVGMGKLGEIKNSAEELGATLILFGQDLTPSQHRNITRVLGKGLMDRTELILDIFAQHARSREGKLQVKRAQLMSRLPSRSLLESPAREYATTMVLDSTEVNMLRQLRLLEEQIADISKHRVEQSRKRKAVLPTVALVGYTNAGKSTLFNALTGADVAESSRAFATLDPTIRAIRLPSRQKVALADTVGFIRDLPADLIAAFRATLEEVRSAALILEVVDAASPERETMEEAVHGTLALLDAQGKPRIRVYNKTDLLFPQQLETLLARKLSMPCVYVSAKTGYGLSDLRDCVANNLEKVHQWRGEVVVPQSQGKVLSMIGAQARIFSRDDTGSEVRMEIQTTEAFAQVLTPFIRRRD